MRFLGPRLSRLRQRWSAKSTESSRKWMRRQWPLVLLTTVAVVGIVLFDVWLGTCGFYGCPSDAEIRAFQPSEGGRVLDRNGRVIGRLAVVRRVNVPIDSVPKFVQAAFV